MQGRFELKFVVDGSTKHRFLDAVKANLCADPHGDNAVYRVSSLYFDTPDYRAYWEKLDGESLRRKYRLRYYSLDGQSDCVQNAFMEIKHRVQNTVYKQRVALTDQGATAILRDARELTRLPRHANVEQSEPALVDEIQRYAIAQQLRAATVITYLREAWFGTVDDRLRVTFDSRCQAYAPSSFADVFYNRGQSFLPGNHVIMEIKFDHAIPCWIRDVLVSQQLDLQRFSKYATGLTQPSCSDLNEFLAGTPEHAPQSESLPPAILPDAISIPDVAALSHDDAEPSDIPTSVV